MELVTHKKLYLVSGRATRPLAEAIANELGEALGEPNIAEFANGEIHCRFSESIRGCDAFIIQTHCQVDGSSINDTLMEQLIMVDAARRASAKRITVVCPHYGYARQDRKASGREPITAKLVANLFQAAGASRLGGVDLPSGPIQGVIERYAIQLGADLAIVHKRRSHTAFNAVEAKEVVGEVEGKVCVVVDDMIDTAGTICAAAEQLAERGASRVIAATTHGVFSGPAMERLSASPIEKVIITDTLPMPADGDLDLIEVLSVAPLIARAIDAVFEDASVSEIFGGENLS